MTSKERVLTTFNHQEPDRVPMWCGASVEFWAKAKKQLNLDDESLRIRFHDDFRRVTAVYKGPSDITKEDATCITPFMIERRGVGYGISLSHPLANAGLDEIHNYPWPKAEWNDISNIRAEAERYYQDYAILGGDWSAFFHDAIDLLGMENFFIKMYTEPEIVDAVLQHLMDYYLESSNRIFNVAADKIDIFFIGNDFGTQTGPIMDEVLFRRFFLPHLKNLVNLGKDFNLKVMMHCCGGFKQLIPALIEIGLDGLHAVQPSCLGMDLAVLKKEFGKKLVFNGCIDSHHVLIDGNPESVKKQTKAVLDIMMPGGGFIAGASHDTILEETPVENILAMFDTILEHGIYHEDS
jgi:uroporphyrinogen decarboxylase